MKTRWHQTTWGVVCTSVLFPPAGLVLLWIKPGTSWVKRIGGTVVIAVLAIIHLMAIFGMRFQASGDGMRPFAYFPRPEQHYAEIEKRAAEDRKEVPVPTPATVPEPAAAAKVEAPVVTAPWPGFYGPNRDGHYTEGPILTAWPAKGLTQIWKRPIGGGYASMAVAEGKVFTIEQRRDEEVLAAYDFGKGRELWTVAWKAFFQETMGGDGPRATPTYDFGRVYALGATGEFRCVRATDGKVLWSKNILTENGTPNINWGMAASPLVVDDQVIVLPGGTSGKSVVSYDKVTGERKWGALDDRAAYTAPIVATLAGQRQLIVVTAARAVGLTLDGKLLWEFPWKTDYDVNSALPVIAGPDQVILSAGYDHGAALVQIAREGDGFRATQVWFSKAMKNKFETSMLKDGVLYGLDEGILAAVDAATGQRKWKGGRYGYGQVLLAGDYLVVTTETGEVVLVKANPEKLEEIARFEALSGKTWNVPAMADGRLLVRNQTEMACYQIAP
jgi:outer membrane protein assembly factor BamB